MPSPMGHAMARPLMLTAAVSRNLRFHITGFKSFFYDEKVIVVNSNSSLSNDRAAAVAGLFAESRTNAAGELRET